MDKLFFVALTLAAPLLGLLCNAALFRSRPEIGSRFSSACVWLGFLGSLGVWALGVPRLFHSPFMGFYGNELSWLMASLVLFVSGTVHSFSLRYMAGANGYRKFFVLLTGLTLTILFFLMADNLFLMALFWSFSNFLLTVLLAHNARWKAAVQSAALALKTFALGLLFFVCGCLLLWYQSGTVSAAQLAQTAAAGSSPVLLAGLVCFMLAAFSQSGVWPFHRWLISSCNTPTPVSAFMHAGLVNGGGLLLARFAPIFFANQGALDLLFVGGCISLTTGTLWKLIQPDIKRMLACSTMGQMGFMYMQCGLGLFPAAVAHLCWHGLFKSFLFLKSGTALQEKRLERLREGYPFSVILSAAFCALFGAYGFAAASRKELLSLDSSAVLIFFAWLAAAQAALVVLNGKNKAVRLVLAAVVCLFMGMIYGGSVYLVERLLLPLELELHRPLAVFQYGFFVFAFGIWMAMHLKGSRLFESAALLRRLYVGMLNASQPAPSTVTASRQEYKI